MADSRLTFSTWTLATSLDKSAMPMWNPAVVSSLSASLRYRPHTNVRLAAAVSLNREWTENDWTTEAGEATWGDTTLTARILPFLPDAKGLRVFGDVGVHLPTSKASQAQTMIASPFLGVAAGWVWAPGGQALGLDLSARVTRGLHRSTTSELESPWLANCLNLPEQCGAYVHSGVRNVAWSVNSRAVLWWSPLDSVSVAAMGGVGTDWLYPLSAAKVGAMTIEPDPSDPNARYVMLSALEVTWSPSNRLNFSLGVESASGQRAPDQSLRTPLFNRFSGVYFSVELAPARWL